MNRSVRFRNRKYLITISMNPSNEDIKQNRNEKLNLQANKNNNAK